MADTGAKVVIGGDGKPVFSQSTYGGAIPLVFGADKITGNVIWASPIETKSVTVKEERVFYQTVSFALAIAEGPIDDVLRIWLGDRLVFDKTLEVDGSNIPVPNEDGYVSSSQIDVLDEDSPLRGIKGVSDRSYIYVFVGNETQIPHGLMTDLQGYAATPGYRGTSYILFENFITNGTSIPNIQVETSANASTDAPRMLAAPEGATLTSLGTDTILVNHGQDLAYYYATGSGGDKGYIGVSYNTLNESNAFEIHNAILAPDGYNGAWSQAVMTPSGFIALPSGTGNPGVMQILNPLVEDVMSSLGPNNTGGSAFFVNSSGFPGIIDDNHAFRMVDEQGLEQDYIAVCGGYNQDVGIAKISDTGVIEMGPFDATLPDAFSKVCFMNCDINMYNEIPRFQDGGVAYGRFLFYVSGGDAEKNQFFLGRYKFEPNAARTALTMTRTAMGTIDVAALGGRHLGHTIVDVVLDEGDNTLVLFITTNSGSDDDWIVKWSPRAGAVLWKTAVPYWAAADVSYSEPATLRGGKIAWIDFNQSVQVVDLGSGALTRLIDDINVDQSLPNNSGEARQYWNDVEGSLMYFSTGQMNKFWIDRTGQVVTTLQTVVRKLLERIDIATYETNDADFAAINIQGFSVTQVDGIRSILETLRKAFLYEVIESNGRILYVSRGGASAATIPAKRLEDSDGTGAYLAVEHDNDIANLRKLNLTYRDPAREYGNNVQSIVQPREDIFQFDSDAPLDVSIPVVLTSSEARATAERLLYAKRVGEDTFRFTTSFRYAFLDPGDLVTIEVDDAVTETVVARITSMKISGDYKIAFEAVRDDPEIYTDDPAITGVDGDDFKKSKFTRPDPIFTPRIIGIPVTHYSEYEEVSADKTFFYYTVLNSRATTRLPTEFPLTMYYGDEPAAELLSPGSYPTWGYLKTVPVYTPNPFTPQPYATFQIRLSNENALFPLENLLSIESLYDDENGAPNLWVVGSELIQVQTYTDEGNNLYTCTGLVRGRYGTERHANTHSPGEICILLRKSNGAFDDASIMRLEYDADLTVGSTSGRIGIITNNENQLDGYGFWSNLTWRPHDVPNVSLTRDGSNNYDIAWERRSRYDSEMPDDGAESANNVLDEATLSYYVVLSDSATFSDVDASTYLRKTQVDGVTEFQYTVAMQTADGFDYTTDTLYIHVYQISSTIGEALRSPVTYSLGP